MQRTMAILPKLKTPEAERVRAAAPGWNVLIGSEATDEAVREAEIVVGWRDGLERILLSETARVKWIQSWSAGMDHLEVDAYLSRGIELSSANGVHAYPISESVFAMLLAFTRKLHVYIRNQAARKWDHGGLKAELHGKTIGIAGVGAIGEEIARIAKAAFGMRVLGVRRSGAPSPVVDEMRRTDRLLEMLPDCDYVVAVLPSTPETKHLFDARAFDAMKETAFFVNVGRGSVVDTEALLAALQDGRIAGAGLDVFEEEPLPADHPLWGMDNVIVTPHTSGSTERYTERALDIFLRNLESYLGGRPPAINRLEAEGKRY